jgi:hypothetical protein
MVQRPQLAVTEREARAPGQFDIQLRSAIGAGEFRVVTTEWDIYFAARALGWKTYYLFGTLNKSDPAFSEFLEAMDYAIVRDTYTFSKPVIVSDLTSRGFGEHRKISFANVPAQDGQSGRPVYPPLLVFKNNTVAGTPEKLR